MRSVLCPRRAILRRKANSPIGMNRSGCLRQSDHRMEPHPKDQARCSKRLVGAIGEFTPLI